MEYYNDILCISHEDLIRNDSAPGEPSDAIMSASNYYKLANEEKINVVRPGKGFGCYALVEVASLPERFLFKVKKKYPGEGRNLILHKWFEQHYYMDERARAWFSNFRFENGKPINPEKMSEYIVNANVLNSVIDLLNDRKTMRRAMQGGRVKWDEMSEAVSFFKQEYNHTLPENVARFKQKVNKYRSEGYIVLIDRRDINQSARKVTVMIEKLLLSIAALPTNPFNNTVRERYEQFMHGEIEICDPRTGEIFSPEDFLGKKGEIVELSDNTIWNYLNKHKNKVVLESMRMSWTDFNHMVRPHHRRHNPFFSFSKISLDDRDLPRKAASGRPKAYYAYDVASGCVIGYAYNRKKNADLFIDCIRNMFQTIERNHWNVPAQVEVENHLVNQFADGLMKAQMVFPLVRWCAPTNSQEKRAEHLNRAKKYSVEKNNHPGIGRWYLKMSINRPKVEKIYDEENNNYKEKIYDFDELVADDIADIYEYNHQLHPNQAMYPGMTRWQVLCEKMNPELTPLDKAFLYRYIGESVSTSIVRNQSCQVQGEHFWLSSPEIIDRMQPGNNKVIAYYLPDENGNIPEVYVYQNDRYVDTCKNLGRYNEAEVEQTDEDRTIMLEQEKYIARFDKMVKDNKPGKITIIPKDEKEYVENAVCDDAGEVYVDDAFDFKEEDYNKYLDPEYARRMARQAL